MKKILFFLSLILVTISGISETKTVKTTGNNDLQNGWYKATVKYTNYRAGVYTTYDLSVKVDNAQVDTILFNNGYIFHSGPNSEDYRWSGGLLQAAKDDNGNITMANTRVSTMDIYHNLVQFDIVIKQVQPADNGQRSYNWLTQFNQRFWMTNFYLQTSCHNIQYSE